MRDLYQVLREKEMDIIRIRQEIEALRAILPLIAEENEIDAPTPTSVFSSLRVVNHEQR
jgi:hypothetical protein